MATELSPADIERLIEQNRILQNEINEWREWWQELDEWGDPRFGEMGERLHRFREHLVSHFQLEEESGFFDGMILRHPDRRAEVTEVQGQHRSLLITLDGLIDRLSRPEIAYESWGDAHRDFEAFLDDLHTHELTENELGDGLESPPEFKGQKAR